ncbi:23S rRNA (uracil(1939)-C(5))-methyltransferase RlmD [Endomicrobium proavitum]|uniref:Putative RNA methyltransferase n=1 Tax=Endomicrobium proavitum TaxID=1408281 RepID=A0A0G3WJN9_9BACT|nr:23S rRNA (uracil(1939)-C(5))-methyltransferase RlmD [Endomicrobium proavitum]AKL98095.1 putative RNA methyltransferase [Endomicrobium proavitum]
MSLKNQTINVKCEKIVFPGRSLCRCADGIALFTEGLLAGETADVLVIRDKKSFREGLLKNITEKSPARIEPKCLSFGRCGGCTFQNTDYKNQIKYKKEYIGELLNIFGVEIGEILQSPQVWNYRNKMEFSFFNNGDKADLGLHCRGSFNRYVSVPPCFIADEDFVKAAEIVKNFANKNGLPAYNNKTHEGFFRHLVLRKAQNNNQFLINIVTNAAEYNFAPLVKELTPFAQSIFWTQNGRLSDAVVVDNFTLLYGKENITEKLNVGAKDYFFNISPFSFFQTNSKGTEILYNEVLRLLNPSKQDELLDLYCGTGTIGISMAHRVQKVIGIEQIEQAVENAKTNAELNKISNAQFYASTAEKWVKENNQKFNSIVIDPPRSGLTNDVIKFLLNSGAKKIVYVSCNPSTLARDLTLLTSENKYKIKAITPVDMFPQTYHVETVVLLEA